MGKIVDAEFEVISGPKPAKARPFTTAHWSGKLMLWLVAALFVATMFAKAADDPSLAAPATTSAPVAPVP